MFSHLLLFFLPVVGVVVANKAVLMLWWVHSQFGAFTIMSRLICFLGCSIKGLSKRGVSEAPQKMQKNALRHKSSRKPQLIHYEFHLPKLRVRLALANPSQSRRVKRGLLGIRTVSHWWGSPTFDRSLGSIGNHFGRPGLISYPKLPSATPCFHVYQLEAIREWLGNSAP